MQLHADQEPAHSAVSGFTLLGAGLNVCRRMVVDFVLPPQCPVCKSVIQEQGNLCGTCWMALDIVSAPVCDRLGVPFALPVSPGTASLEALTNPPIYSRARCAVLFNDQARQLVHGLKYRDRQDYALPMARMMVLAGRELLDGADFIVPVPLHWRRLWSRRFNQSQQLAERIGQLADRPLLFDGLTRTRATPQQVGLSSGQRKQNVAGAFSVSARQQERIRGRRIVLIDDVLTTGATANAASRAMQRAGATQVDVLIFAQVAEIIEAAI